jgi:hypothetical protein
MNIEKFRIWIAPISQSVAVLVVVATIIIWWINLQSKVDGLEAQVRELKAALAAPNPPASNVGTCTNLADRFAAALSEHTKYGDAAAAQIRTLMADLGCVAKPQSK